MKHSRVRVYLTLRLLAGAAFLVAVVIPPGIPAALLIVAAGITAVATCFGTNAGGPGEAAGARPMNRWLDQHAPPQGDWPPYSPDPSPTASPTRDPEGRPRTAS